MVVATGGPVAASIEELRERARRVWALGDYRVIGARLEPAAGTLVDAAGIGPGQRVIDVGVGTGNVALAAARRGAAVIAVDIADTWWPTVRERAGEAGVDIDLLLGDAEELPLGDGSADATLSCFAAVFAPRHELVAAELVRVTRPGGTIAFTAWPLLAGRPGPLDPIYDRMPAPPAWAGTSTDWGEAAYVERRFGDDVVGWRVETHELDWRSPSLDDYLTQLVENAGPVVAARERLTAEGSWEEALAEVRRTTEQLNEADDGSVRLTMPYRVVVGTRR